MENEDVKEILEELYKDVAEWLKFAEAKNSILLTITGALLFGFLKIFPTEIEWLKQLRDTIIFSSFLLIINILVVLYSFFPMLNIRKKEKKVLKFGNINLLYYKDIAYLKKKNMLQSWRKSII